jgi:hypothetical protein
MSTSGVSSSTSTSSNPYANLSIIVNSGLLNNNFLATNDLLSGVIPTSTSSNGISVDSYGNDFISSSVLLSSIDQRYGITPDQLSTALSQAAATNAAQTTTASTSGSAYTASGTSTPPANTVNSTVSVSA